MRYFRKYGRFVGTVIYQDKHRSDRFECKSVFVYCDKEGTYTVLEPMNYYPKIGNEAFYNTYKVKFLVEIKQGKHGWELFDSSVSKDDWERIIRQAAFEAL